MDSEAVVRQFWCLMASNDFHAVVRLAEYWPERLAAAANRRHLIAPIA